MVLLLHQAQILNPQKNFSFFPHKTGKIARFYIDEEKYDGEGDLQFWILKPCTTDIHKNPKLKDVKFIVFND